MANALIRCDAGPYFGFGHLFRCLSIAAELQQAFRSTVRFAISENKAVAHEITEHGFPVFQYKAGEDTPCEGKWLLSLVEKTRVDVLLLDVRNDLSPESVACIRARGVLIVIIDDSSDRRLQADLAFYPPVPQARRLDWERFEGKAYIGWDWIPLRKQFASDHGEAAVRPDTFTLLVAMGGSDPTNLTLDVLNSLDGVDEAFQVTLILGPGYQRTQNIGSWIKSSRRKVVVKVNPDDIAREMRNVDIAVASFGMTAYELAACGVPAIHLCASEDHAESATALAETGSAVSLGLSSLLDPKDFISTVTGLIRDSARRRAMSKCARALFDGKGAWRIARTITEELDIACP